jgi:hypothetical protein
MGIVDSSWFDGQRALYIEAVAKHGDGGFPIGQIRQYYDIGSSPAFDAHYARCDLWAASLVMQHNTFYSHMDIGSRVDGFCTHVLSQGASVMHVDIRDPGFSWGRFFYWIKDDARTLETLTDRSETSVSCLHSAEHVGLGRYGDEIDPHGMHKCMSSLARILAPGGRLYFACPIGRHRVVFNAHRIASPRWVCDTFDYFGLTLENFAAVDDADTWHPEAVPSDFESASYACGCFEFRKPA